MIQLTNHGVYLLDGVKPVDSNDMAPEEARKGTIA